MPNRSKLLEQAFGRRLQDRRLKRGISQEELAHQSGLHRTYISQIERGLKSPTLATIYAIASALEEDAGVLTGGLVPKRSGRRYRLEYTVILMHFYAFLVPQIREYESGATF